jgi:ubiquinol-cytochrome c reductase cytochrome b subunit
VLFVVLRPRLLGHGQPVPELLGPADPTEPYSAARPEWFMLWLFQFLKLFPAGTEVWGAVIIPLLVLLVIAPMPWIGRGRLGPAFNTGFVLALFAGVIVLTTLAVNKDHTDPEYQAARRAARVEAARAKALAQAPTGLPPSGALSLLGSDPLTQGPRLFARNCASCHRYDGHDATGRIPQEPPTASDLRRYGSREWIAGLLDPQRITSLHYFGGTKLREGKMVRFVTKDVAGFSVAEREQLDKVIVALSAEAQLKSQREADHRDAGIAREGRGLIESETVRCAECHKFHDKGDEPVGPELTGYGSREWLMAFIADPAHPRFYGSRNDRMPLFGSDEVLDVRMIGLVVDWLRGEWYEGSGR